MTDAQGLMTVEEFCDKAEWEGGWEEAIFSYGLTHMSLSPSVLDTPEGREFFEAVKELTGMRDRINELTSTLYRLSEG